jgi:hypothetical protein
MITNNVRSDADRQAAALRGRGTRLTQPRRIILDTVRASDDALQGIDTGDHVRLHIRPHVVVDQFEAGHSDDERALVVDHPADRGRSVLTPATQHRLAEDLA